MGRETVEEPLNLESLCAGDRARLMRAISGYAAGTVGTVAEVSARTDPDREKVPTVAVDWPAPVDRFGPSAKPTRDWFTQEEQDRIGFLARVD